MLGRWKSGVQSPEKSRLIKEGNALSKRGGARGFTATIGGDDLLFFQQMEEKGQKAQDERETPPEVWLGN